MKKTKEMYAGGLYLFQGQSSANSSFIEDREEAMKFITTCNKKLAGYLIIHDFLISRDGWQLLVELRDEENIKNLYLSSREKSRKAKDGCMLDIVWKIISEQLRVILSNFVVYTNKKNGRSGGKVARSYERFWFETFEEAEQHLQKMRRQLIRLSQKLRKYRPTRNHYRIRRAEGKGAIFLCSLKIGVGREVDCFGDGCIQLVKDNLDVLRQLVLKTNSAHNEHFKMNFYPKLE